MKPLHYTASALALGLALMGNAQAVTTIPFWHSMEGELGKEVDSLAQRFNAENPDYKIVPTYKRQLRTEFKRGGLPHFVPATRRLFWQVYEVGHRHHDGVESH
ncbi:glycerol-3-phosphate ABC transporter, substrate-binding protein [Escherichia coli]|nr:glycerol-3-phosphate ABC transporter, substrate-binding protein [Escherichia coli]